MLTRFLCQFSRSRQIVNHIPRCRDNLKLRWRALRHLFTLVWTSPFSTLSFATMSRTHLSGTFADFPATILVDSRTPESTVSTTFINNNNVPRSITSVRSVAHMSCSGPVVVPTTQGWYQSRMPFKMAFHVDADVGVNQHPIPLLPSESKSKEDDGDDPFADIMSTSKKSKMDTGH